MWHTKLDFIIILILQRGFDKIELDYFSIMITKTWKPSHLTSYSIVFTSRLHGFNVNRDLHFLCIFVHQFDFIKAGVIKSFKLGGSISDK